MFLSFMDLFTKCLSVCPGEESKGVHYRIPQCIHLGIRNPANPEHLFKMESARIIPYKPPVHSLVIPKYLTHNTINIHLYPAF